jgi:hypothetical protein
MVTVPTATQPVTARASAAFCSSPGAPTTVGSIPTIIAAAVSNTGRSGLLIV